MEFNLDLSYKINEYNDNVKLAIKEIKMLNEKFLDEIYNGNKVAYYYENIKNNYKISFNSNICFYAASSIKILVCLYLFEKAVSKEIDLNKKINITVNDLKDGTGIIKYQKEDSEYSILELIKHSLVESDNTAYIKLMNLVGKDKIKEYGNSLGAIHTMEGKETDSFGIINCQDMIAYWKAIKKFIDANNEYSDILRNYLTNPTYKIIEDSVIGDSNFLRKYGEHGIAYHEAGYLEGEFFIFILTQLNQMEYKNDFINDAAKRIKKIHKIIDGGANN